MSTALQLPMVWGTGSAQAMPERQRTEEAKQRKKRTPDEEPDISLAFYRKHGCPRCNQTGYKGRIGIYQLLAMTEDLASLAAKHASREDIERAALDSGMRTMWDDGLAKVAAGLTSIEELARVTV